MSEPPVLDSPVNTLKGVGPARERGLASMGVLTVKNLFLHFPKRYEDRRKVLPLVALSEGRHLLVSGTLLRLRSSKAHRRDGRGKLSLITAILGDGRAELRIVWFNSPGLSRKLEKGRRLALFGKVEREDSGWKMVNPEIEFLEEGAVPVTGIIPVYPLAEGLGQAFLRKLTGRLFHEESQRSLLKETLPEDFRLKLNLAGLGPAIEWMHYPPDEASWKSARRRLVFEELFNLQVKFRRTQLLLEKNGKAPVLRPGAGTRRFLSEKIPFKLTDSQLNALEEIWADLKRKTPMRRLLHGDVGSGKTVVALGAVMAAIDSGQQAAFMVPTEILAQQHFRKAAPLLNSLGVDCVLMTGGMGLRERGKTARQVREGKPGVVFGTHALFQSGVDWGKLGLVVVDEQHRFGVAQKAALVEKGQDPHLLVMSATPIPRTLILTAFGELDVTKLKETLPGRKPVSTRVMDKARMPELIALVVKEIESGGQVVWVCPHLEESGESGVASVESRVQTVLHELPGIPSGFVHGRMSTSLKEEVMDSFGRGDIPLLIATSVVEVGIDVPGASLMIIEDPERFGLSQLHQLRGRVGRGTREGCCVLFSSVEGEEGRERLRLMESTSDGFAVAESDLKWRGPGALCGIRQHGVTEYKVADLSRDRAILELARGEARKIGATDPLLNFHSWFPELQEMPSGSPGPLMG